MWGLDVEQHRSLTRMVRWTNVRQLSARIQSAFPSDALRPGEQALLRTLLLIGEDGQVERCTLAEAAQIEALPSPACPILKDAVFEPALDREGQPMRSFYVAKIVYTMG